MQVVEINPLPSSSFMKDYVSGISKMGKYFSYSPYNENSWCERVDWLSKQSYINRNKLVQGLMTYNLRFNNEEAVLANIKKLESNDAFVVIGGQQAGLLTGPMFVISKAITILKLAEEMKKKTGKEMVPVFWIASEDHDFAEVNHVFVETGESIEKVQLSEKGKPKASVSKVMISPAELDQVINHYFNYLGDSTHQHEMRELLSRMTRQSTTLSEMFAKIMSYLFGKHGLVLVDSDDPFVRDLEVPIFSKLIEDNLESALLTREQELMADGYRPQLENLQGNAHFFLHLDGERQLMTRGDQLLVSKNGRYRFTEEELKEKLVQDPRQFSSNVVSRPIMQEYLFPVAAFVGGPGEIAYWAQLGPVFDKFDLQMPIVFPRLTFTIIERNIASYIDRYQLSFEEACYRWDELRSAWLKGQGGGAIDQEFETLTNQLHELYMPFLDKVCDIEPGSRKLGEANWQRMKAHLDFLQKKSNFALEKRHEASLKQWSKIRQSLQPMDIPQERVYNVFGYLNKYGTSLIDNLNKQTLSLSAKHKLIYI